MKMETQRNKTMGCRKHSSNRKIHSIKQLHEQARKIPNKQFNSMT